MAAAGLCMKPELTGQGQSPQSLPGQVSAGCYGERGGAQSRVAEWGPRALPGRCWELAADTGPEEASVVWRGQLGPTTIPRSLSEACWADVHGRRENLGHMDTGLRPSRHLTLTCPLPLLLGLCMDLRRRQRGPCWATVLVLLTPSDCWGALGGLSKAQLIA